MNGAMAGAVAALLAGGGTYLIFTPGSKRRTRARRPAREAVAVWMGQAGLAGVSIGEFSAVVAILLVFGALAGYLLFDGLAPALVTGGFAASFPLSAYRRRRAIRLESAAESWPRLLEEMRLRSGSLGMSVPQALFEAGRRAPAEWRDAFSAAEREWLLTTDFARTLGLLKAGLADPTADVVCETLLLAHEVGGTDLDGRLSDLIDDRVLDLQNRKEAASRQAGVRFARRFVLLVPLGMALAGLSIGSGRHAYSTAGGQVAVVVGLAAVVACWVWSGRLMRLPRSPRVFR